MGYDHPEYKIRTVYPTYWRFDANGKLVHIPRAQKPERIPRRRARKK